VKNRPQTLVALAAVAGLVSVAPAAAQLRPTPGASTAQLQARHELSVLEGILENAVRYGAQMLTQQLQAANSTDMVLMTGTARARGFRLDDYGVVFDVEFPSIRRSIAWSMRALQRPDPELLAALQQLRRNVQSVSDPRARQDLDRAIKEFEAQIKALGAGSQAPRTDAAPVASPSTNRTAAAPGAAPPASVDPRSLYLSQITNALADALLDHGAPIDVGPDDWLTVAARESADRRFVPGDPSDAAMTFVLRIKGSDLNALRERRLSREEARKRVDIKLH
jgi:hypothetical protein